MADITHAQKDRLLRRPAVQDRTGLGRSSMYERIKSGTFPSPIRLAPGRAVGWLESDIDSWIEHQVTQSRVKED